MMTWSLLLLVGLAFFVVLLVAVPVGLIALATSPDVQRTARRAGAALLPLGVIGVGLLAVLGTTAVRVAPVAVQPPPQPPMMEAKPQALAAVVPVDDPGDVAAPPTAEAADANRPVAITSFAANSDVGQTVDSLPNWVTGWSTAGNSSLTGQIVLTSRRYSTPEEAEQELLATLRPRLAAYLQRHDAPIDASQITLADLRSSEAILGRVQEQFTVDLGSTQEPVYRMTWQVWLRPSVRDVLAADYRLAERDERLWQLGLGAGLLTLLFGAWAAYFRIDDRTQGRYRGRLKLAALATTLAGAAVTLLA